MNQNARILEEIFSHHQLTRPSVQRFHSMDSFQLILGLRNCVNIYRPGDFRSTPRIIRFNNLTAQDCLTSLSVIPTYPSPNIFVTSKLGFLMSPNPLPQQPNSTIPCTTSLWSSTIVSVDDQPHIAVCTSDSRVQIYTPDLSKLCEVAVPDPLLSLDFFTGNDQILMAGGSQGRSHILVYDLNRMARCGQNKPCAVLSGGKKPGCTTRFIDDRTLVHGSWDGCLYLYKGPFNTWLHSSSPLDRANTLSPIYSLETGMINGVKCIFCGCGNGRVDCFILKNKRFIHHPEISILDHYRSPVKALRLAHISGRPTLFVGCRDSLYIVSLEDISHPTVLTTNQEVAGIGFIPLGG